MRARRAQSEAVRRDVRARPHPARRELLLAVLYRTGSPIQAVPATDDRTVATTWYDTLRPQGARESSPSGYAGPRARPRRLVLELDGKSGSLNDGYRGTHIPARV